MTDQRIESPPGRASRSRTAVLGSPARTILLALVGVLLLQAGWALVVPPFRGMDEHDHAYKAAAVAHGDWDYRHDASPQGWGEFVAVPPELVVAAGPICESLPYTTPHNCAPVSEAGEGLVLVASSASRYNPVFYWAVGAAGRLADGATSLLAMRLAASLLCAALIALAAVSTIRSARTAWRGASLMLALTPMMLYTTAIVAPNGVEVAGATVVWAALLAVVWRPRDSGFTRSDCALVVAGAAPLGLVRGFGPVWLLLIVAVVGLLLGGKRLRRLAKVPAVWLASGLTALATLAGLAWTLSARTVTTEGSVEFTNSVWTAVAGQWVLWFFQSVAAFPARDELGPLALYCVVFAALWCLLAIAWRLGSTRERLALTAVLLLGSAVPIAATVETYERIGMVWQGRYAYPFTLGFILICGLVLDRTVTGRLSRGSWPIWASAAAMGAANLLGQLHVLSNQLDNSPLAGTDAWWAPPVTLVVALNVVGFGLLAAALLPRRPAPADSLRA